MERRELHRSSWLLAPKAAEEVDGLMPGRTDDRGLFAAGNAKNVFCWEGWWSRSGSNRRPPE
jgi:hypothetical protein